MKFEIEYSSTAAKGLSKIQRKDALKIKIAVTKLETNPFPKGYKKLRANEDKYRIRVGNYRIIYAIENDILTILILKIGTRGDIYKD